jgi:1,5-anhydro-D-fructose reductase (1,5-anhydro-D-mannitol-forming)
VLARQFRWGLVGLGRIADTEIAPGMDALESHELTVVVSRDQARADSFAASHGARRATISYDDMLDDDDVDAVYIATPNALHAEQVVAAAAAGKHVLCDKPLATSVPDAEKAIDACRSAGVRLGIMFQTRRFGGVPETASAVRAGALGRVVMAHVEMSAGRNLPKGWRTDPALAGLGTVNNIGVHAFDLLRYLLDAEVAEVAAMVDREEGFSVDTAAAVLLRFDNGTLAYVNANQAVPYAQDDFVLYGTEGRVLGRNLSRPGREGTLVVTTASGQTESPATTSGGYRETLAAFAEAVQSGNDPSPSGVDGLRSVQLTGAIATAIESGAVVRLPSS